jgi:xanthosine utilization system XapX-like protein
MTKAARSVFTFGVYLVALGLTLVVAPNVPLSLFGMPAPDEPWIRVAGMLALLLGYYYVQCARAELRRFFELTVGARFAVIVFFAAFVALGFAKPTLLLFGTVDIVGAIWTALALRADAAAQA